MKKILLAVASFFKMIYSAVFGTKQEKARNKNLLKRGGYSVALIALVLVCAVILNLLVVLLADRVNLEFDLTSDKKNSISRENHEYISKIDKEVTIYFLTASADEYAGGYMQYYANQVGYSSQTSDYYKQTCTILEKYGEANDKITVKYVDPFGTEMSEISTRFPDSYAYGDILVIRETTDKEGNEKIKSKRLSFPDIYLFEDITGGAQMGYDYYYISESCLETKLTSAIASVISEQTRKIGFIKSHGGESTYGYYKDLLELNNFEVSEIDSQMVVNIDSSFDALVISAPETDFAEQEINAISEFLSNDGKLGKTLLFFGDTTYQKLPNLYSFLSEWGIEVKEGIVFETDDNWHLTNSYSTIISQSTASENSIIKNGAVYLTGYNLPLYASENSYGGRTAEALLKTSTGAVTMPIGTTEATEPDTSLAKNSYATLIKSVEQGFVNDVVTESTVLAFSSIDFISETFVTKYSSYCDYKDMSLRALQVPTGMDALEVVFENKKINAGSQLYLTNESVSKGMLIFFAVVLPLMIIACSAVVFFRRRNL